MESSPSDSAAPKVDAINSGSPESPEVQDSSIFCYISDLSPIKPFSAVAVEQGFPGFSSSPLVFTSPQINRRRKSPELKRTQCPLSPSQPDDDDKDKNILTRADESEKSDPRLSCGLNPQSEKVPRSNSSGRDQTGSSTGYNEENLDDLLADYRDSTYSASSGLRDVSRLLDGSTGSKEPVKLAKKDDQQDLAMSMGAFPEHFEQSKEENQGSSSFHLKPGEKEGEKHAGVASSHCLKANSDVLELRHSKQPVIEFIQGYSDYGETTGIVVPNPPIVNTMMHIPKATPSQRGNPRRLQFDEAQNNFIANSPCSWNPSNSPNISRSPASPGFSEVLDTSCVDILATPSNMQLGNMSQSKDNTMLMSTVSKPSGIGLHLNSIVNVLPLSSSARIKVADRSYFNVKGSASSASSPSPYITIPPLKLVEHRATSDLSRKANSEHSDIIEEFNQASPKKKSKRTSETSDGDGFKRCRYCDCFTAGFYCDDSCACQGCFNRVEYEDTVSEMKQQIQSLRLVEHRATSDLSGKANSEHSDIIEEFNQASPKKKSKRTSETSDGDGCKRCNCKKTKCLKLYCDCFAAGFYCDDPCACQGCFNRVEYEDTVSEMKQQIQPLRLVEHRATSDLSGKANSEHSDIIEEFNQASPKKKSKRTSKTSDGDGCKRCNCKKTKCLKLYCDCFAAEIYCDDPCACQGCFNRVEYEDTVSEMKQQIKSRNPLAFAPKIIQRLTQAPAIRSREHGDRSAPLSGRHKKGCNCKKSMCLKKYCECYQANVGCSDLCRCEGCKNIYGRKGEYNISKEVVSIETINDKSGCSTEQKRELGETTDNYLLPEFQNPQSLTTVTPTFQSSVHGKDASKSRPRSARYLPSPESDMTLLPPNVNAPGSPRNSAPHEMIQETRKDILDLSSFNQEPEYDNVEVVGGFSSKSRKLGSICHLNSLPTYPTSDANISFESPKTRDSVNNSRPQFGSGGGLMSSVSSCHVGGSPMTPETPFSERKHQQVNSDDRLYDILEDETPQILKENPTPCNIVKVSSPNKKRVSPPHSRSSSSSLIALKSGGKFILQSVPSLPPLTPCTGSRNSSSEQLNGPQNSKNNE